MAQTSYFERMIRFESRRYAIDNEQGKSETLFDQMVE